MATTTLKIDGQILMFMTVQKEDGNLDIDLYMADDSGIPYGKPSFSKMQDHSEEQYHKDLRTLAKEKGHWLPEYSTHPEFNP